MIRGSPSARHSVALDEPILEFLQAMEAAPAEQWRVRCARLVSLVESMDNPNHSWHHSMKQLRILAPSISTMLRDPRSTVVRVTCQHLTMIFDRAQAQAQLLLYDLLPSILYLHSQTVGVMRTFCQTMMTESLPKVPTKSIIMPLCERVQTDKSRSVREACALYLCICLKSWKDVKEDGDDMSNPLLSPDLWHKVGMALLCSVHDAHPAVRKYSKEGLMMVDEAHPSIFVDLQYETDDFKLKKWVRRQSSLDASPLKDFLSVDESGQNDGQCGLSTSAASSVPRNVLVSTPSSKSAPRSMVMSRSGSSKSTPASTRKLVGSTTRTGSKTPPRCNVSTRNTTSPLSRVSRASSVASPVVTRLSASATGKNSVTRHSAKRPPKRPVSSPQKVVTIALKADDETVSLLDDSLVTARPTSPISSRTLFPDKQQIAADRTRWIRGILLLLLCAGIAIGTWKHRLSDDVVNIRSATPLADKDAKSLGNSALELDPQHGQVELSRAAKDMADSRSDSVAFEGIKSTIKESCEATNDIMQGMGGVDFDLSEDASLAESFAEQVSAAAEKNRHDALFVSQDLSLREIPGEALLLGSNDALEEAGFEVLDAGGILGKQLFLTAEDVCEEKEASEVSLSSSHDEQGDIDSPIFLPRSPFCIGKTFRSRPSLLQSSLTDQISYLMYQRTLLINVVVKEHDRRFQNTTVSPTSFAQPRREQSFNGY